MELSEEARAELAAAVKILRDDGVHIHKTYRAKYLGEPPADPGPTDPKLPPKTGKDPADPPVRKRGLGMWGAKEEDPA
jgi:hypothetical protein